MTSKRKWGLLDIGLLTGAWIVLIAFMTTLGLFIELSVNVFECLAQSHRDGYLSVPPKDIGIFLFGALTFGGAAYACLWLQDRLMKWVEGTFSRPDNAVAAVQRPEKPIAATPPRF